MKNLPSIIKEADEFVSAFLKKELSPNLIFHNYSHTKEVVFAAEELCSRNHSSSLKKEVVMLAAWFHDCGYSITYNGHEEVSCKIADQFFNTKDISINLVNDIRECIMATKYPQDPKTMEAKILCDADLFHFTRTDYDKHEERLRLEWEICCNKFYTDTEWNKQNCLLLTQHQYFTEYGKEVLQKFKEINIEMMRCKI